MMHTTLRLWTRHRADTASEFGLLRLGDLPVGCRGCHCPECGSGDISGAIVCDESGAPVVPSADEVDPNLVCLECGYWDDSFPPTRLQTLQRHTRSARIRALRSRDRMLPPTSRWGWGDGPDVAV
ncbi:MAG: hypothetical protein ACYTGZ_19090 [Planctomycetota bacterium]|jgi:hypothetical protein